MNKDDLGSYFIKNGRIYHVAAYCSSPTLELIDVITGQRTSVAVGSQISTEYEKLVSLPIQNDGTYNLDKYKIVDYLNLQKEVKENDN